MPKTRLISPGSIPNHKLLKNLQLQDNYLSNDGGDEGIRITDAGLVGIGVSDPDVALEVLNASTQLKLSVDSDSFATFSVENPASQLTIATGQTGTMTLDAGGNINIDTGDHGIYFKRTGSTLAQFRYNAAPRTEFFMYERGGDTTDDYFQIFVGDDGSTTLTTVDAAGADADMSISPDGYCNVTATSISLLASTSSLNQTGVGINARPTTGIYTVDKNNLNTTTSSSTAVHIDYDHTEIAASGQTVDGIGLDLDMHCNSVTHVGTVNQTGIDLDMVALTDGTQTNTGIDITCTGADTNTHLKLSYDATQYAAMSVDNAGVLTIQTNSNSSYDDIVLDFGRYLYLKKNGASIGSFAYVGGTLKLTAPDEHLELSNTGTDKDITINAKRHVIIESDGGTFTPSADGHVATKKYVDDEISGGGGSARSVAGDTDNAMISWVTSDNTFAAEANLTFDGTDLLVASTGKLAVGDTATYIHQVSDSNLAVVADGDITLDANDDIEINANGGTVTIKDDTASHFLFDCDNTMFRMYDDTDAADFFSIIIGASGATTISTTDDGAAVGHLTLDPDGDVILDPVSGVTKFLKAGDADDLCTLTVTANGVTTIATADSDGEIAHLTLDADGDINLDAVGASLTGINFKSEGTTFGFLSEHHAGSYFTLYESGGSSTDDYLEIKVEAAGATTISTVDGAGAVGHLNIEADGHVEFDNCAVGFDKLAGTFGTASVTSNPNDSTDIDFRLSNKYELELTNNMDSGTDVIALIFPNTSGNFILTLIQDGTGSRTVHADSWKAHAHDGTACDNLAGANGTDGLIRWAGGSAPTLTTTADKTDIISVYWDADNQTAFAVASLNF